MMLLGLLDRDILAQASQKEDAGQAKLFRIVRLPETAHHLFPSIFGNLPQCCVAAGRPV